MLICGGVRSGAGTPSSPCISPLVTMERTMSAPPTSSPFTYNCGMVGQLPNSLMPWRIASSANTLTVW
jgi:hypothetical protein